MGTDHLDGPEPLVKCALIHLHSLYGEVLDALKLVEAQAFFSPFWVLGPIEELRVVNSYNQW